jgi:hypothetical protein
MKRFLVISLVVLMFIPAVFAARKKEMAGTVNENTYTDSKFPVKLTVLPDWTTKVKKAEENIRLVMIQKNWRIPDRYKNSPDYTMIPRLVMFVDTTNLSSTAFMDSILSQSYKSKAKKIIQNDFEFLGLQNVVQKNKKIMTLAGETASMWQAEAKYVKEISESASSSSGIRVSGAYSGVLWVVKKDNNVVLFELQCEADFYESIVSDVLKIINSLSWAKPEN